MQTHPARLNIGAMAGKTIYGLNAVREAIQHGHQINRVFFAKESRAHGAKELIAQAKAAKLAHDFVPQAKLNELTGTREHQGVAAQISPVDYLSLADLLADCPNTATLLVLDQIQHARNLGMMIRSAAGAGAHGIVLAGRGGVLLDETVLRASAGTMLGMRIAVAANLSQTLRALRDADFWVYALAADGEQSVYSVDWPMRRALVIGNETRGIRPGVAKNCDATLSIPLAEGVESLNAAVAASIVLFQAAQT